MLVHLTRRLLAAIPLVFAVLTLSFFLIRLAPGSPFDRDAELPPSVKENLAAQYGLDLPMHVQYGRFLAKAIQGDFGSSYMYRDTTVAEILAQAFPISATIGLLAMILALVLGTTLGIFSAVRQNSFVDYATMTAVMAGKSVPPMVLAPLVVAVFALSLRWIPVAGWNDGHPLHLIGPVVCLGLYDVAAIARLSRASMLEVLRNNYVTTARAKGLAEWNVVFKHAAREGLLPLITYLGPALSSVLIGTVVVEQIFNIPGLGRYLVSAATNRDYTLVLGIATLACVLIIALNTLSDLALALADPRIRLNASGA